MSAHELSIVVAGGGTAGHIEPALAVADAFAKRGVSRITALGTPKGLEGKLVPARGYDLRMIDPVPVPRKLSAELLKLPFHVAKAVHQARAVLREVQADALVGFGGYVSAPAYLAARREGIPFFIHEANAKAGLANKLGVFLGGTGFNAVENSGMRGQVVGIPVRASLAQAPTAQDAHRGRATWGLTADKPVLVVTGGSQGARSLNTALAGALDELLAAGIQVLHLYGAKNDKPAPREGYVPVAFSTDMAAAYAVADVIVCRSGAMTVAEVTAAQIPAIYVPLPHGNGEQGLNAAHAVAAGAARLYNDADFDAPTLSQAVLSILQQPATLEAMRLAATAGDQKNPADVIVQSILERL